MSEAANVTFTLYASISVTHASIAAWQLPIHCHNCMQQSSDPRGSQKDFVKVSICLDGLFGCIFTQWRSASVEAESIRLQVG